MQSGVTRLLTLGLLLAASRWRPNGGSHVMSYADRGAITIGSVARSIYRLENERRRERINLVDRNRIARGSWVTAHEL